MDDKACFIDDSLESCKLLPLAPSLFPPLIRDPEETLSISRAAKMFGLPKHGIRSWIDRYPDIFQETKKGTREWEIPLHEMEKFNDWIDGMVPWVEFSVKLREVGLDYFNVKAGCRIKNIKMPHHIWVSGHLLYDPKEIDNFIEFIMEKNMFPKKGSISKEYSELFEDGCEDSENEAERVQGERLQESDLTEKRSPKKKKRKSAITIFAGIFISAAVGFMIGHITGYDDTGWPSVAEVAAKSTITLDPKVERVSTWDRLTEIEKEILADMDRYLLSDLYYKASDQGERDEIKRMYWQIKLAILQL